MVVVSCGRLQLQEFICGHQSPAQCGGHELVVVVVVVALIARSKRGNLSPEEEQFGIPSFSFEFFEIVFCCFCFRAALWIDCSRVLDHLYNYLLG